MAETDALIEIIVDALNAANVDYVLIGGAAMMLHGVAYVTQDVDLCYARNPRNVAALVEALAPFWPSLRLATGESVPFLWETRTVLNGANFTLQTSVGDVDILASVTGIGSYEDMMVYIERYAIGERNVPMLTIEGLIVSKRAAGTREGSARSTRTRTVAPARSTVESVAAIESSNRSLAHPHARRG